MGASCPIPETADATPDHVDAPARRVHRGRLQAARASWRIGTEHEKFGFRLADLTTPPYLPADGQPGAIRDLLDGLARDDAEPILDHGNIDRPDARAMRRSRWNRPGQLELSGAPVETLHETKAEMETHFAQVRSVAQRPADRLRPARLPSAGQPRGDAVDAEGPLRHHAPLHADGRRRSAWT